MEKDDKTGQDADFLPKEEKRGMLLRETGGRCMLCGKAHDGVEAWSVVRIAGRGGSHAVSVRGCTVICRGCTGRKGRLSVTDYAASLPFRGRAGYLLRVLTGRLKGAVSGEKKALLLSGFSLFRRREARFVPVSAGNYGVLVRETRCTCIYCGTPLHPSAVTYDHIVPKSLGGANSVDNYVTACAECNAAKGCLTVAEYLRGFSVKERGEYVRRVENLVRRGLLPEEKAGLLLDLRKGKRREYRIRLFGSSWTFTLSRSEP